jgi:hypothetical protein
MASDIIQSLDFPDCRVVLFDWSANKDYRFENLACLNADGSLRWMAALPQDSGPDCFVGMALDNDQLRANSMSGFALWLDIQTGSALKTLFTK